MKFKSIGVIFLVLTTLLFVGCRTAPIQNISDVELPAQDAAQEDIARAIVTAGSSLGWSMRKNKPGHLVATLYLRTHIAIVDIYYDSSKFSIIYKDSTNLNYDGTVIHSNYNGWVSNLASAINNQVANL